jgi:hypothetical protein
VLAHKRLARVASRDLPVGVPRADAIAPAALEVPFDRLEVAARVVRIARGEMTELAGRAVSYGWSASRSASDS